MIKKNKALFFIIFCTTFNILFSKQVNFTVSDYPSAEKIMTKGGFVSTKQKKGLKFNTLKANHV